MLNKIRNLAVKMLQILAITSPLLFISWGISKVARVADQMPMRGDGMIKGKGLSAVLDQFPSTNDPAIKSGAKK
ncbi:MAG TPA: hypothetical protein VIE65_08950 [Methylobacter sp.]|jgi:hypothetical protein